MKHMVNVRVFGCAFSPRHGNTEVQVKEALRAAEELPGVEAEFYSIAGKKIEPCDSCYKCFKEATTEKPCPSFADAFDEIVERVDRSDGIVFGCPVYYMTVTAQMKAFMDRSMGIEALGYGWRNKVAGFLTVAYDREGGHETTIRDMQNWALMHDMIAVSVGPERPAKGIGGYLGAMALQGWPYPMSSSKPGVLTAIKEDEIGMYASRCVGWRVAEIAKIMKAGFQAVGMEEMKWPKGPIKIGIVSQWEKKSVV